MDIKIEVNEWAFHLAEKIGVEVFESNMRNMITAGWVREAAEFYVPEPISDVLGATVNIMRIPDQEFPIKYSGVKGIDANIGITIRGITAYWEVWFEVTDYLHKKGAEGRIRAKAEINLFKYEREIPGLYAVCALEDEDGVTYDIYDDGQTHEDGERIIALFRDLDSAIDYKYNHLLFRSQGK